MARLPLLLCFLWLLISCLAGCSHTSAESSVAAAPAITKSIAEPSIIDLVLIDLDGHQYLPLKNEDTKATALVFILPDCPICNTYMPELNRLHEAFASRGVNLVLVHVDPEVTPTRARSHAVEYQIKMPVALDPGHSWVKKAGAMITPEVAVFSPRGELLYRGRIDNQYAGLGKRRANVTSHDLAEALEAVLAGQPVPEPRTEAVGCLIPELSNGK